MPEDGLPEAAPAENLPKLYSPGDVAVAALIGSPLAGAIVMAINYRRLGNRAAARNAVLIGLGSLAGLVALGFLLPGKYGRIPVAAGAVFGTHQIAKQLQGARYEEVRARTGQKASGWAAAGIGALCMAAILAVVLVSVVAEAMRSLDRRAELSPGEGVYYGERATEEEALKLARFLKDEGVDLREAYVRVERGERRLQVTFAVGEGAWNDAGFVAEIRKMAGALSEKVFGGEPLDVRLLDEEGRARRTVLWEESGGGLEAMLRMFGGSPQRAAPAAGGKRHVVAAGESLWAVAKKHYGRPPTPAELEAIARASGIEVDATLRVGQTLVIPPARE